MSKGKTLNKFIFGFHRKKSVGIVSYVAQNGLTVGKGKLSNDITILMAFTVISPHYRSELWTTAGQFETDQIVLRVILKVMFYPS